MAEALCGVCGVEPKKYKCPTCSLPYCSLQCFKIHKPSHPERARTSIPNAQSEQTLPEPPPPAPIPRYLKSKTDFSTLATNPKFKELVKTYPQLLPTIQRVYAATIEPDSEDEARRRRLAILADRGRGSIGRGRGGIFGGHDDRYGRWTQKKGDSDAMNILKGLRNEDTEDKEKDAMKAFIELVDEMFGKKEKDEQTT